LTGAYSTRQVDKVLAYHQLEFDALEPATLSLLEGYYAASNAQLKQEWGLAYEGVGKQ
jgi:hypothetical protein